MLDGFHPDYLLSLYHALDVPVFFVLHDGLFDATLRYLSDIKNDLIRRDEHDKNRKLSPLKKAGDAIVIDTSNCSVDEQVESIYKYIERV